MRVITGNITSRFGNRFHPIEKKMKLHNGVDISAPVGTPVFSPCDGEIMGAYMCPYGGGKTLLVADTTKTIRFSFAHLNNNTIFPVGMKIKKKQKIAESGKTGQVTGPHLHFGVKIGGKWVGRNYAGGTFVNPEPYLTILETLSTSPSFASTLPYFFVSPLTSSIVPQPFKRFSQAAFQDTICAYNSRAVYTRNPSCLVCWSGQGLHSLDTLLGEKLFPSFRENIRHNRL